MRRVVLIAAVAVMAACLAGVGPGGKSKSVKKPAKSGPPDIRLRVGPDEILTVNLYLNRLRENQAYLGIDEYFDTDGFIARVFGDDSEALVSEEYAYLRQMMCVFIKATVTLVPADEWKHPVAPSNLRVTRVETDSARVKLVRPAGGAELHFELRRGPKGWRIADLPPLADAISSEYRRARDDQKLSPVDYLEGLVARTLDQKRALKQREQNAAARP